MNASTDTALRYRAIWISDIHLGTRGCNAELLLDFLRSTDSQYLYLVGDIVDIWRMRKSWYWHQEHNDVVQKLLRKARKGTRVIYIPGNHDENFRDFAGHRFGRVVVLREAIHVAADGRRFLVMHGDQFDGIVKYAKWLAFVGDRAYNYALAINVWFNRVRRSLGFPYWSLSAFLKHKVKNAVEYISNYEKAVVAEARRRGVDGVICGHIHTAEIRTIDDVLYCNDGDWVESCTALVEHLDGRLEILNWADRPHSEHMSRVEVGGRKQAGAAASEPAAQNKTAVARTAIPPREGEECASASLPTPGFRRLTVSFARSKP